MICLPITVDLTVFECILNLSLCVCYAGRWLTRWCSTLRWQSLGIAGQSMMERGASTQPTHCLWHPQGWAGKRQIHTILTTSHWMHSPWSHHCCPDSSPPPPPLLRWTWMSLYQVREGKIAPLKFPSSLCLWSAGTCSTRCWLAAACLSP